MSTKELRIGNIVIDDEGNTVIIEQITGDNILESAKVSRPTEKGNRLLYSSNIYPIPLTEEILLKCGFKKTNYDSYFETKKWSNGESIITVTDDDCLVSMENTFNKRCEDLHQLQNLYFALTGQELTINL